MTSILQAATDKHHLACPICGQPAQHVRVRLETVAADIPAVHHADCICPAEHLFIVRWSE